MANTTWNGVGHLMGRCEVEGGGEVVLVDLSRPEAPGVKWVTGFLRRPEDDEWCWGHYFDDLHAALEDFGARARKGH